MSAVPQKKLTVDEFLAWAKDKPGRFDLHAGTVYAMAPERAARAELKFAIQRALPDAIVTRRLSCHMLPDGMTVRIDDTTAYEPDALVYCGPTVAPDAIEIDQPVILVEVLSPSTRHIDASAKLAGYFKLPSVQHYLIIDPERPTVVHHARRDDGTILTCLVSVGVIDLTPPGLSIDLDTLRA